MIEMSGAVTGLITTAGHRDEIELRRGYKEDIWDPALPPPPPIAPRRRRIGVPERLDFEGAVVDAARRGRGARRAAPAGAARHRVAGGRASCSPSSIRRTSGGCARSRPRSARTCTVSLSHEVMPAAPEFERTSTTLVNAYVGPKIKRYLERLVERLRDGRLRARAAGHAVERRHHDAGVHRRTAPVTTLGSGPDRRRHRRLRRRRPRPASRDFVCADMGGTSYDVCLIRDGAARGEGGLELAPPLPGRSADGRHPLDRRRAAARSPRWSRARCRSARAAPAPQPGPICYGRGGAAADRHRRQRCCSATSTPVDFCGGRMTLQHRGRCATRSRRRSARPLGIDWVEAAYGIYRLVNANMANAIRRVAAQRGVDPRALTMVAYGGNGPVHATAQADELGIARGAGAEAGAGVLGARAAALRPSRRRDARVHRAGAARSTWRASTRCSPRWRRRRGRRSAAAGPARATRDAPHAAALLPGPDVRHGGAARRGAAAV